MGSVAGDDAGGGKEERILVSVRLRPLNEKEVERNDTSDWECINASTIIFKNSLPERSMFPTAYTFDRVFSCESTTKQVYEEGAKEVAMSVVSGINSSIFAYGQTSSGKTYTMTGITEYSVSDIYDYIRQHSEREFILKFSAMEIYNEAVRDLLSPDSAPLRLLDDPEKGTIVERLTEETLRDQDHVKELLSFCEVQRQIGETSLNEMSSRSHQILRLTIESSAREFLGMGDSSTLAATVNFVDLAGSERASQALSAGTRLKEGCHINRSLLTLGTVIRKLSKGRNGHIPYRDSKLTRILQSSLGGNARTAIICTMSPARSHIEQSRNTLLFASCAKEVVNNAQVNVVMSDKALVKQLQRELARLESELRYAAPIPTSNPDELREKDAQIKKMEKEMKELMQQRDVAQSRLEDLLQSLGDDQGSRQWDGASRSAAPHAPNSREDAFSISEASQSPDFGNIKLDASPLYPSTMSSPGFMPREEVSRFSSCDFEDQCKEVRCIEVVEPSMDTIEDSSLLLTEDSKILLPPSVDAQEPSGLKPKSENEKDWTRESSSPMPMSLSKASSSSRIRKLVRSTSCRASLTTTSSPWVQEEEEDMNTPPNDFSRDFPGRPEGARRRHTTMITFVVAEPQSHSHLRDGSVSQDSEQSDVKTNADEGVTGTSNVVEGPKEMTPMQYQKQLTDGQICPRHLTYVQETDNSSNGDSGVKITVKDVCLEPVLKSSESPSRWPLEFEKKQREIVELWHACNASLVHRSYFFLLIKGDPTDSFYIEVEYRRLSFLKNSQENQENLALSEKNLRREREKLRRDLNRLPVAERERLYTKWGVALDSKERRLQVSRRVWTDAKDMEHARESAVLVAKVFGLLEPSQAPREMFGLSFAPQLTNRRSFMFR